MSIYTEQLTLFLGYWGSLALAIVALVGVWLLNGGGEWCQREWRFLKSAAIMQGPPALPLIGNALYFACKGDELLNRLVRLSQPYNFPFRFWMGPKLFVGMRNPRDIEVVLNSSIATHKPYEYRFLASYLGSGIVTDSGSTHRAHRKLIMPMVNGKALNTYLDCFDKYSQRCVKRLESHVDIGEFDIMHLIDDYTLDIILETIMGTTGTAQNGGYKGLINYSNQAIGLAHERTMKGWLHLDWIYARTNSAKQYAEAMGVLQKFSETLVTEKTIEYYAPESNSCQIPDRPPPAVLDRLIDHNEQTKLMDNKRLRSEISNIWMPAQDPTALTSSFLFLMLGMHPEVQDKVRAEIREIVGDEEITTKNVSKLKYLEMVFKETVRLFPVGPVILRKLQDDLDFETCTAPKGCTIALLVYMAHRDPKHWVDPERFDPDRFTPENSVGRHPYAFVPFSSGIRGCIGRHYATMVVKTLVARVVQKYRIGSSGSLKTLRLKAGVSIRSIDGYNVSITAV